MNILGYIMVFQWYSRLYLESASSDGFGSSSSDAVISLKSDEEFTELAFDENEQLILASIPDPVSAPLAPISTSITSYDSFHSKFKAILPFAIVSFLDIANMAILTGVGDSFYMECDLDVQRTSENCSSNLGINLLLGACYACADIILLHLFVIALLISNLSFNDKVYLSLGQAFIVLSQFSVFLENGYGRRFIIITTCLLVSTVLLEIMNLFHVGYRLFK